MEVALAVEVLVVMTEVVGVEVGEDEGVALTVGIVVAVGVSVGLILGSGEADGDGVIVLVGTGVLVYEGVLVGMGVEVAVAGEPLADAEMRGNTIVPSDIRNPASRSIRAGRRKRSDWVIVAPFDPVFFLNYSGIMAFVKREGDTIGISCQLRVDSQTGLKIPHR